VDTKLPAVRERELPQLAPPQKPVVLTPQEYAELLAVQDELEKLKKQLASVQRQERALTQVEQQPRVTTFFD
jgi:hypothetical protein